MNSWRTLVKSRFLVLGLLVSALIWNGCGTESTSPGNVAEPPIAKGSALILSEHTTESYPEYAGACQTSGLVEFQAWDALENSGSKSGEPVVIEWSFMIDRGAGLEPSPDWGSSASFVDDNTDLPLNERTITLNMFTIGIHQATLTVRTRDGRKASTTLEILVTSCESCGE